MERVEIEWLDANHESGWMSLTEAEQMRPTLVLTVGWLVWSTAENLCVCGDVDTDSDSLHGVGIIPRRNVTRITVLAPAGDK